ESIPSSVSLAECGELARLAAGARVLELGSYLGRSTVALASTATIVHSIDVHRADFGLDSTVTALIANLDRHDLRHKVVAHVGFSQLVLPVLPHGWFDFAFIDGQHQREPVEEDLSAVVPLLRPRATVAFHDYGVPGVMHEGRWDDFAVTEVVDAFVARTRSQVRVV